MLKIIWAVIVLGSALFLIFGRNIIKEAFRSGKRDIDAVANELKEQNDKQESK
ncbi:hypothetical protein VPT02_047 [Vibrio phage VPT02]|uniref:Uncharacterized protein n=1 Tax=Vibrio phage pVp-1 TaxID=1150989 RepID=H6WXI7_9CAUD|nr:hypothetical protein F404_gp096 [Vibrio phage pVp-1]AFB83953.1 hypothetical protein pVp-1_0096 [Vibrio phage pVp-1]QIG60623.1 hypothetical protein VPT02_047 [Vibrio phage VPT02]QQO38404.1 hypothetical protein VPG01_046 [Vibrio phage VPG01]